MQENWPRLQAVASAPMNKPDMATASGGSVMTSDMAVSEACGNASPMAGSEPGAALADDWRAWSQSPSLAHHVTPCFPVAPGPDAGSDPNLRFFPETDALSVLGFGDYSVIPELWGQLYEELDKAGIAPAGPARLIALVAPYVGAHIRPDEFCYECIVSIDV